MNNNQIKSGKEILDNFFQTIGSIPGVDKDVAKMLLTLYQSNKLSNINISNAILKLREDNASSKH